MIEKPSHRSHHYGANSTPANKPNPSRSHSGTLIPGGRYGFRIDALRSEAAERAEAYAQRSPADQLAILDKRLGKDVGAKLERTRLHARMSDKENHV